ncbi:MAG: hypothetical protein LLG01_10090 [Planctomycetaceae bacterium]|nr:hypothetical protein [Planctomycetaceae bacterium]
MSNSTSNSVSPPPLTVGVRVPSTQPVWPMVIGIISIVWGAVGVMGSIAAAFTGQISQNGGSDEQDLFEYMPAWWGNWVFVASIVSVAMCAMLVVGGILLVKRRRHSRGIHLLYAYLDILTTVAGTVVQLVLADYSSMTALLRLGHIAGMAAGAASLTYPVFLLVWFCRRKIKKDLKAMREATPATTGN